jgi:hypothetical protein
MRAVRAAAVQLSPVLYSREATVDKVVRKGSLREDRAPARDGRVETDRDADASDEFGHFR